MSRTAIAAFVFACCSLALSAQEARVDTVLVLKNGQEVRGQFVGFRNGLFTLRLPDGRITIHGVGDVDRMQPAMEQPSTAAPAAMPSAAAPPPMAAPAAAPPAAAAPAAAPPATAPPPSAAMSAKPAAAAAPGLEAKACGPEDEKFPSTTDKTQHPAPGAPADKGVVYIIRPSTAGGRIQTRLAVDGMWMGANYGNNYFLLTLTPGEHLFCSQASDRSVVSLNVEAGKIYYLQQTVTTGMTKARSSLDIVAEQDGREGVVKSNFSVRKEPAKRQQQ
jgi:Protein of unknown function (DUF2846)